MRIAYLNPQPIPGHLPSTLQALQFADALAAVGNDVWVVTPVSDEGADAAMQLGRAPAISLTFVHCADHRRRWYFPFSSDRLFRREAVEWLKANRVDVVYLRNLKLAEVLIRSGCEVPIIFETHELFAQTFREHHAPLNWRAKSKLVALEAREAFVYRHVAGLVAITQALLDDIRDRYRIATPAMVAPDGVALDLAGRALETPTAANPVPVLLYLGSLHRWKGVETLIEAMPMVAGGELWIAGGNPARIRELSALPAATQVGARIRFLGPVPPAERFVLIARADLCLLPLADTSIGSRYTSPLKLFEYMAMGKAIIASDLDSIREVVDADSACLVPAGNAKALAQAINRLAADAAERSRLGDNACRLSVRYGWKERASSVVAWLEQVL